MRARLERPSRVPYNKTTKALFLFWNSWSFLLRFPPTAPLDRAWAARRASIVFNLSSSKLPDLSLIALRSPVNQTQHWPPWVSRTYGLDGSSGSPTHSASQAAPAFGNCRGWYLVESACG